jgi:hypothetical protein
MENNVNKFFEELRITVNERHAEGEPAPPWIHGNFVGTWKAGYESAIRDVRELMIKHDILTAQEWLGISLDPVKSKEDTK